MPPVTQPQRMPGFPPAQAGAGSGTGLVFRAGPVAEPKASDMARAALLRRAALPAVRVVIEVATAPGEKSSGKTFPPRGQAIDAETFRRWFALRFAEWLNLEFQGSAVVVALAFGRDVRTAQNWLAGRHTATGDVTVLAFLTFPSAMGFFLAEWQREQEGR